MKRLSISSTKVANWLVATILVLVPFHAFMTVWGSTLIGHYDALRLWSGALLLALLVIVGVWLVRDAVLRKWFFTSLLVRLILAYVGLTLLLGAVALAKGEVSSKALLYGLLVDLRYLAWFLAVIIVARRSSFLATAWPKLLWVPALVVMVFAVLQYMVLPHNVLSHFGYKTGVTIQPVETINHNNAYIRVQSTLRGANPLGAYLVLVSSAVAVLFAKGKWRRLCIGLGLASLLALFASGSRSAWIGLVLSLCVTGWLLLRTPKSRYIFASVAMGLVVVAGGSYLLLRNNASLQNHVLHTQDHSSVATSSNSAHVSATVEGLKDVVHEPFGDGPGTAGPASVYNTAGTVRIAEDYYVQIAQETGWVGVALFMSIVVLVAIELYQRAGRSVLALVLFASLIGILFINLLSHAWTDDTLAFLWWGLAGVCLGTPPTKKDIV